LDISKKENTSLMTELKDGKYKLSDATSADTVTVAYNDQMKAAAETPFFPSIEQAAIPQKPVGFREQFMNMTLFSEGMPVGLAAKSFGSPFVLNI